MKTPVNSQFRMEWNTQEEDNLLSNSSKRWSADQLNRWLHAVKVVDSEPLL